MKIKPLQSLVAATALLVVGLPAFAADENKAAVDNTKVNERDRGGELKTPIDQSNKPEHIKITKNLRAALVKDSSVSMAGKNVKIITSDDGMVTLRGPVASAEEKMKIEELAKAAAGGAKVDSQLDVKNTGKK